MSTGGPYPSTLADVLRFAALVLAEAGDPAEWYTGERYLEQEGAPPRIVAVPTGSGSTLGPVLELGARQVGSITEGATLYVWGAEHDDDTLRYEDARARLMRVIAAINASAPGRVEWRGISRGDATRITTYGEEYRAEITYVWAVPRDEAIDRAAQRLAAAATLAPVPPRPDYPRGSTGAVYAITVDMEDTR